MLPVVPPVATNLGLETNGLALWVAQPAATMQAIVRVKDVFILILEFSIIMESQSIIELCARCSTGFLTIIITKSNDPLFGVAN
jgi:hypothetical protein